MGSFKIKEKDILFILKEQLNYGSLCKLDRYKDLNEKTLSLLVSEAIAFAKGVVDPLQEIGEEQGVFYEKGEVQVPQEFKDAFKLYGENGWIAVARDVQHGGFGFPGMMRIVCNDPMYAACQGFNIGASLTHGAGHLIESFATDELKELFVSNMFEGKWSGTMALTEPDSGSDLASIKTTAYRDGDHFKIKGTKQFISFGAHDMTDNIVHLLLARIEGAPAGVKGISLFIVPKIKVNPDGSLGEPNDITCAGLEHKLGLHAAPTCVLNLGDHNNCTAYLCGEENKGLVHMFQMMNQARINTGVNAMAVASTAYRNALAYTKDRVQGAGLMKRKEGAVPIINHPDVRRMLLWMKATVDGMRSMCYTGAYWSDLAHELPDGPEKEHYLNLENFITPIIKAYCSEMGFKVCETAMQCLGGYGYCKEYPLEQYLRDSKSLSLYEGTNGIQSIDLMGRKMRMNKGAYYQAYLSSIEQFCSENRDHPVLGTDILHLSTALEKLKQMTTQMIERADSDPFLWGSATYPALLCFGDLMIIWRLLDMAVVAQKVLDKKKKKNAFYQGKVMQATWYAGVTLPITMARMDTCLREGREVVDIPDESF
jgi:alkylation response protein AidB-like acyl-CoA dehydrogenase